MKKLKKILLIILFLSLIVVPNIVFASSKQDIIIEDDKIAALIMAILIELFYSIHMSVFVLLPLSRIFSQNNWKKIFIRLFLVRAVILLFLDFFFIPMNVAIFETDIISFAPFIIIPIFCIVFLKQKISNYANDMELERKINSNEINGNISEDNSPVVLMDFSYINNDEKKLLKNIIFEEIQNQGEDINNLITEQLNTKKNIIIVLFGLLTFIYMLMYYFNVNWIICLFSEIVTFLLYIFIIKKINILDVITKRAINNPDEDIFQIISEVRANKKEMSFSFFAKTGIAIAVAIVIPSIIFVKSKILYVKFDYGYAVAKYTRGLISSGKNVVIPDTYKGKDVIAIEDNAFKNSNIKNVTLPKKLEYIKSKSFYNCRKLESITIPNQVTEIRASAFENCVNLKNVVLPDEILDIRAYAFKNDKNLSKIELPSSLSYLGAGAFSHCSSLVEITIPEKVIEINGQTFEYCTSLRKINFHDNIISIHGENFVGDVSLDNVELPSKIKEIRGNTFEGCSSLSTIKIPDGVTRIGGHAFYGCSNLSFVYIPDTVIEIGSSAFRCCSSLYEVKVPARAVIDQRAFKESPTRVVYK